MSMNPEGRQRVEPFTRATLPAGTFFAAMPVRFGHCDPAGIVFTPRYFDILNEAIERFFIEALGFDYYGLLTERRVGLGYVQAACEFWKPSRMGDVLDVAVLVERIGRASYTLVLPILNGETEVARGRLVTAPASLDKMTSSPIPTDVRAALTSYQDRCSDPQA